MSGLESINMYSMEQNELDSNQLDFFSLSKILINDIESFEFNESISEILESRSSSHGLNSPDIARLLKACVVDQDKDSILLLQNAARKVRFESYKNDFFTMAPLEVSSYCQSNCHFCGWRQENKEMVRLWLSDNGILEQLNYILDLNVSHVEIVGGDSKPFLRDLPRIIELVKNEIAKRDIKCRVSICTTPLHQEHYDLCKSLGLDAVLTWQETYDENLYYQLIDKGPKCYGIDHNFNLQSTKLGFKQRILSHYHAAAAGLQVGLGCLIGLSDDISADVLSTVLHAKSLLSVFGDKLQPVIFGMPIVTDVHSGKNKIISDRSKNQSTQDLFEIIASIYLLSMPNKMAWVFPNCRVNLETQSKTLFTAGCFTSTEVRVGPGAYTLNNNNFIKMSNKAVDKRTMLAGEQFLHHFHTNHEYLEQFYNLGLSKVNEANYLKDRV